MVTEDLLETLKIVHDSEADKRVVIVVDGKEWDIETIIVTVGDHSDGITRIVAKTESSHWDRDRPESNNPPYYIQRGFPTPQDVGAVPNTNLPVTCKSQKGDLPPSHDVRVSVGTPRHIREWIQSRRQSLGGIQGSSISLSNVIGQARR